MCWTDEEVGLDLRKGIVCFTSTSTICLLSMVSPSFHYIIFFVLNISPLSYIYDYCLLIAIGCTFCKAWLG
ncbi:hypothetical protein AB205_0218870 [Aquarana catesbeiana]|uniref:Uncharacterized protein n=1 Tax=Aquarana catesbeiana TaxID=8400 RepID=A0A2G9QFH5_AQUCT|nr:hypothetical protein AB205_0218870 [Aquarana catesbeiana]